MSKTLQILIGSIISIIIAIITIYFTVFYAPPRTLEGTIRDSITQKPIAGVEVFIDQNKCTTTDDGVYVFEKIIKEGYKNISTKKEGYKDYNGTIKVKGDIIRDILLETLRPDNIPIEITISNPTDGSYVGQSITVTGKAFGNFNDTHLWIVVHPIGSSGYWPQVSEFFPNKTNGQWSSPVNLGNVEDTGKSFEILVINANQQANNYFNNYLKTSKINNNYPEEPLPNGSSILAMVTVDRK